MIYSKENALFEQIYEAFIKHDGLWRPVQEARVKLGGQWKRIENAPENMIVFWDEPTTPTFGQICNGSNGSPNIVGAIPRGATSQGTQTGSDTHGGGSTGSHHHTALIASNNSLSTSGPGQRNAHEITSYSLSNGNHLPLSRNGHFVVTRQRFIEPGSVIFYRGSGIPYGFATASNTLNRFLRGGASLGNVGAASHTHSYSHFLNSQPRGALGNSDDCGWTGAGAAHSHSFSGTSQSRNNNPPSITLHAIKLIHEIIGLPLNSVAFFEGDSVPNNWLPCDGTSGTPDYINAFIRAGNSVNESLSGASTHSDATSSVTSASFNPSSISGKGCYMSGGTSHQSNNHNHPVPARTFGTSNTLIPRHIPLMICMKVK